jgi:argininosuccinate lyase
MSLIVLMKSQPLAYNKDNQEDKEPLFDTVDTVRDCLKAFGDLVPTLKVRRERMRQAARAGFTTATDFADYLVRRGIPFRDAHAVVGQAVKLAVERGADLQDLTLADYQAIAPQIDDEVFAALDVGASLNARNHRGGTAPVQVRAAAARARARLANA